MKKSKMKIIEVTFTEQFMIDLDEYPMTWGLDNIVDGWFKDPNMGHAGRDGSRIGNSKKFVKWREVVT